MWDIVVLYPIITEVFIPTSAALIFPFTMLVPQIWSSLEKSVH